MKRASLISAVLLMSCHGLAQDAAAPEAPDSSVVFREPFTLKLPVDKDHVFELNFGGVPYVHRGDVYLFNGESFGVRFALKDGKIDGVIYEANLEKADVTFDFQRKAPEGGGDLMTLLTIKSHCQHRLLVDALMTTPQDPKDAVSTSILPVEAGLMGFE